MTTYPHLLNAPIEEAVIAFSVNLPKDFQVKDLLSIKDSIKEQYPHEKEIKTAGYKLELKNNAFIPPQLLDEGLIGYLFKSTDEKEVVQLRLDGLTFSRLKPYTNWDDILKKAKNLYDIYISKIKPNSVNRIAVRYINHIKIPKSEFSFSDYIKTPPTVPAGLPQKISNYFSRMVINLEQDIVANFIQAHEVDKKDNLPIIILDIDVFKTKDFETDSSEIWSTLERFREIKNKIFFNTITNKTQELFL
ncbi:TIGR04255 family protein [Candidatus Desantisbacteria bacterium]|nr:TIGR04255 family protein [Candidatus Desantisbacteria bacterium]